MVSSRADGPAELVCIRPFTRLPASPGFDIVHLPETGENAVLPAPLSGALGACTRFRSLESHAEEVSRRLNADPSPTRQLLDDLAEAGFFFSLDTVLEEASLSQPPPPLDRLAVLTHERPAGVTRCVASFLANAKEHGRKMRVVVSDDSKSAASRATTREALTTLARQEETPIDYVSIEGRRVMVDILAKASGVDRSLLEFALLDPEQIGTSIGANRNTLSLLTAGERVLSADDDTICRAARTPGARSELSFHSENDPQEYWFFRDRQAAFDETHFESIDVLGEHSALLGRTLGQLVASTGGALADIPLCSHTLRSLLRGTGRVRLTPSGIVGDSGMDSGLLFLILPSPTYDRLVSSSESYDAAFRSRSVLRGVPAPSVSHPTNLAGTVFGLDNSTITPPFPPVLRNEDGVYSMLLRTCFDDGYFGFPTHAVVHDPLDARVFDARAFVTRGATPRFCRVVMGLLLLAPEELAGRTDEQNLRARGRFLREAAALPPNDFESVVSRGGARVTSDLCTRLRAARRSDASPRLSADVDETMQTLCDAIESERSWIPSDLPGSEDERSALTRRLVGRFGELLEAWPAVFEAARRMREDLSAQLKKS